MVTRADMRRLDTYDLRQRGVYKEVTPDDDNDLELGPCQGLNVGVAGKASVIGLGGGDPVSVTLVEGWNPCPCVRVRTTASSTNVNYPANSSWVDLARTLAFAGHRSDDTDLDTPPGALVLRDQRLATDHIVAFDSDNSDDAAWPATAVDVGGTASGWHSTVIRLVPELEDAP